MKKFIAIAFVLTLLAASVVVVSAKEDRVINSYGDTLKTETFGFCLINYTGFTEGPPYVFPDKHTGKILNAFKGDFLLGTTVIKNWQGKLTINGQVIIVIGMGKMRPNLYNLTKNINFHIPNFLGKYKLPDSWAGEILLKGIAYDVKITYWI